MSLYNRVAKPTRVAQHEVEALDALAKGDKMGAVEHLKKGVELAESMGRPNGACHTVEARARTRRRGFLGDRPAGRGRAVLPGVASAHAQPAPVPFVDWRALMRRWAIARWPASNIGSSRTSGAGILCRV